ncbi:thymidylate kinase, partial [Chlamydia psittaci 08-2626_L3]
FGISHKNS